MTRQEFIAQYILAVRASGKCLSVLPYRQEALREAQEVATELETSGEAPWVIDSAYRTQAKVSEENCWVCQGICRRDHD